MKETIRKEKKYLLNAYEYMRYKHLVEKVLVADIHNSIYGYQVRSLYFDTLYDKDFYDKEDGLETRKKIRLRTYSPIGEVVMLEMKQKQGECQIKRSLKLTKEDAIKLIQGDYTPLLKYEDAFAQECFGVMSTQFYRPKVIVEYTRYAYLGKVDGTRITFDSNLKATKASMDLFSMNLNMSPILDPINVVLEVKYNGFLLNYIKDILNYYDKSELSVSKYTLSRKYS